MNAFNEYGVPNAEVEEFTSEMHNLTNEFFHRLAKKDYSPTEIRAIQGYLNSTIDLAASHCILEMGDIIRKNQYKNVDLNLSKKEMEFAKEDKIKAIRAYRERTGLGLKEAKDAVEKFLEEIRLRILCSFS